MSRNVVILYGDCQISYLADLLKSINQLNEHFDFHYISIIMPWQRDNIPAKPDLNPEIVSRCAVLWKQVGPDNWIQPPETYLQDIPSSAKFIKFPSVFFNAPWFRYAEDPLMRAIPPLHPTFPYQDPVLSAVSETPLAGMEAYRDYERRIASGLGALPRVLERELQILARRDEECDVPITAYIYSNFKRTRLFWNGSNPTNAFFTELIRRLLSATWPSEFGRGRALSSITEELAERPDPFHYQRHIISAPIADALKLEWWEPSDRYWTRLLDLELTAEDYVSKYLEFRRSRVAKHTR